MSADTPPARRRPFLRRIGSGAVVRILTGSFIGQGTVVLVSPILTRLYSPSDFAALAVVTAVSAVIASVATLSWDRAVVVPRNASEARTIVWLGIIATLGISTVFAIGSWFFRDALAKLFNSDVFVDFWWLIPTTAAIIGLYSVISSWLVRRQQYTRLAIRNATMGLSQAASSVSLGFAGTGVIGLLSSIAVGRLVALIGIARIGRNGDDRSIAPLWPTVVAHRKFPLINTWSRLLNSLGLQLPVILIVALFGSLEAGMYALTLRVLASPVSIVTDATSQYFEGKFAHLYRGNRKGLRKLVTSTSSWMAGAAALPTLALLVFAPAIFDVVFGSEWGLAGVYAQALVLGYYAQIVISPVSRALVILGKQGTQLAWDSSRLIAMSGVVLLCASFGLDFLWCAAALAAVQCLAYVTLFGLTLRAAATSQTL